MEQSPAPGWYTDPTDGARHRYWDGTAWTGKTRSTGVSTLSADNGSPPRRTGMWIALGFLVFAGISIAAFLLLRSEGDVTAEPEPGPSPSETEPRPEPSSTTDPGDVVVPEGWSLYTSETGVMSYAVDPAWEDMLGPADQDYIHSYYTEPEEATSEYSGAWLLFGSAWTGGTSIHIMTVYDGLEPTLLKFMALSFAATDVDDYEVLLDEEFTSAHGYEGWRLDYWAVIDGVTYQESVIMLKVDMTLITVYASTNEETAVYTDGMLALVDSIVVHHAPAEG